MIARLLAAPLLGLLLSLPAVAFDVEETLDDPALEARALDIGEELRCLVCQNQSIGDSNADLAKDLRRLVRERLAAGDSDEEIIAFMTERYGDYVLLKPPVKPATYALWFGPAALFLVGAGVLIVYIRRVRGRARRPRTGLAADPGTPLSDDERHRLEALLDDPERS